jgi:hypothetical protein
MATKEPTANQPCTNTGANTYAAWLMSPHSRATLTAVSGLSPVIIRHGRCAARSASIAGAVPGFSLFSKMISPRKRRPDSACSLAQGRISGGEGESSQARTALASAP